LFFTIFTKKIATLVTLENASIHSIQTTATVLNSFSTNIKRLFQSMMWQGYGTDKLQRFAAL